MTVRWRIAAPLACVALICGAAALWAVYKRNATERLAETAKACRVRAEQGNAKAQCDLAYLYHYGQGLPRDHSEAVRWLRKAADQGYAKAQYALGLSYRYGEGVVQDWAEALRWYRKAADQGYAKAQYALGFSYWQGEVVPKDDAEAVRWYRMAADQGYAEAQYALGIKYRYGEGVPKDRAEALRWYRKAAGQGHADAQYALRVMEPQSLAAALAYCTRATFWVWRLLSMGLAISALVVLRRRGRATSLSLALMSAAGAAALVHELTGTFWRDNARVFVICFFALLSACCALLAIIDAVRASKRDRSAPTPPSEGTQGSPT